MFDYRRVGLELTHNATHQPVAGDGHCLVSAFYGEVFPHETKERLQVRITVFKDGLPGMYKRISSHPVFSGMSIITFKIILTPVYIQVAMPMNKISFEMSRHSWAHQE